MEISINWHTKSQGPKKKYLLHTERFVQTFNSPTVPNIYATFSIFGSESALDFLFNALYFWRILWQCELCDTVREDCDKNGRNWGSSMDKCGAFPTQTTQNAHTINYTRNQKSNHTSYCLLHKQP